jgi:transposase-like protein
MQTIRTEEKRTLVLRALVAGYSLTKAAEAAGIARSALHRWKDEDPEFQEEILDAIEAGTDRLEDEALRRALDSSDTMLIFTLKARRREKWGDKQQIDHKGDLNVTLADRLDDARRRVDDGDR